MKHLSLTALLFTSLTLHAALPVNQSEALRAFIESKSNTRAPSTVELLALLNKTVDETMQKIDPVKNSVKTLNGFLARENYLLQAKVAATYKPFTNPQVAEKAKVIARQVCCRPKPPPGRPSPLKNGP